MAESREFRRSIEHRAESLPGGVELIWSIDRALPEIEPVVVDLKAKTRQRLRARADWSEKKHHRREKTFHSPYVNLSSANLSIRQSVNPSVRQSVSPSICPSLHPMSNVIAR